MIFYSYNMMLWVSEVITYIVLQIAITVSNEHVNDMYSYWILWRMSKWKD